MTELEQKLGYPFQDSRYLETALRHSSYVNEHRELGMQSNERLEFLGDSVLGLVAAEYLYKCFAHLPEGELTKARAMVVCEHSLSGFARQLDLGSLLHFGKGLEHDGPEKDSILADAFEALLAAIYLDGGFEEARRVLMPFLVEAVERAVEGKTFGDYKTKLQEIVQKNKEETLRYVLVSQTGPDHNKVFEVEVRLNSNCIGRGRGHNKKTAEQQAAKEALELMGE